MPEYTVAALAAATVVVAVELTLLRTGLFRRRAYWVSMAIVVAFQVAVDGWLTKLSAPIVLYDEDQTVGLRVPWDIPVEDFVYGFALLDLGAAAVGALPAHDPHQRGAMKRSAAALLGAGWVLGWLLAGPRRLLRSVAVPAALPSVSVIVPARDEQSRLPRLLAALAAARPAPDEVIVVDDGSSDDTAGIARRAGATVLTVAPPEGWSGKAWACHRGAMAATGDVLVFLDADTEPSPDAVALLAAAAEGGELVSVQPRHRVERAYEAVSIGPALVTLLGAGTGGPPRQRWWRRPMAFGPAIAVRRDRYERFGGHGAAAGPGWPRTSPWHVPPTAPACRCVATWAATGSATGCTPRGPESSSRGGASTSPRGRARSRPCAWWRPWPGSPPSSGPPRSPSPTPAPGPASPPSPSGCSSASWPAVSGGSAGSHRCSIRSHLVAFLSLFARSVLLALVRGAAPWRGRQVPVRVTTGRR